MSRVPGVLAAAAVLVSLNMHLATGHAHAATVQTEQCTTGAGTFTCATGITGLSILGGTWNIDFIRAIDVLAEASILGSDAAAFGEAINSALNAAGAERVLDNGSAQSAFNILSEFIPPPPCGGLFCFDLGDAIYYQGFFGTAWTGAMQNSDGSGIPGFLIWVEATEAAVIPVPPAIVLMGTALGGLGFFGWRRKRAAAA